MARALAWGVLLLGLNAGAVPVLVLVPHQTPPPATAVLEVFEDASLQRTVEQVDVGADAELPRVDSARLNVGYRRSIFWVRFRALNTSKEPGHWLLEVPLTIDDAMLFTREADGHWVGRRSGKMVPMSQREVQSERLLMHVSLDPGQSQPFWLRMSGDDILDLTPTFWTDEELAAQSSWTNLLNGLYFGVLVAMGIFNLFLFVSTRDRTYFYYALFQLGLMLTQAALDQTVFRYLLPESPEWAARSEILLAAVTLFGAVGFARSFLELANVAPGLDRGLAGLMGCSVALGAVATLSSHRAIQQAGMALVIICAAAVLTAGVVAWRRGSAHAQLFLWGWMALLCAIFATSIAASGFMMPVAAAAFVPRLGSLLEAVLLSFGLALRIRALRREHKRAQEELLEERTAQARVLEERVEQRTRELKQAQLSMVQQARLASLGHLVAGVAHEVGNPLNFTRGGAEDLARRLDQLDVLPGAGKGLEQARRALKLVQTGNDRIHQIVENLRNYVRTPSVATEPTDLTADLEATLLLVSKQLDERDIRVHRDLQVLPKVRCRPGELSQVFTNLLLNSAQAIRKTGDIFITGRHVADRVELTFRDTGPGIALEHREAIFDPFFTTRPPSEGTGLGLSVSHEIVTHHGGELRLVSGEGGATFSLSLPVEPAS